MNVETGRAVVLSWSNSEDRPGALLHRAGFGLTHQSYAFWFGDYEGLRAEPQWNLSRILNILSTVGIVNGLRLPAAGHHRLICRPVSPPALRSCPACYRDAGSGLSFPNSQPLSHRESKFDRIGRKRRSPALSFILPAIVFKLF